MFKSPFHATIHSVGLLSAIYVYERLSSTNTLVEERYDRCSHQPSNLSYTGHSLVPNNSLFIQNRKYIKKKKTENIFLKKEKKNQKIYSAL